MVLFSGPRKTIELHCFAEIASATLETSWTCPGCSQEPSRKDPGKHSGIHGFCTFREDAPSWKLPGGQCGQEGCWMEGFFQDPSSILPGSFQENGLEISRSPGSFLASRRDRISDPRYPACLPGNFLDVSRLPSLRPGTFQVDRGWKFPVCLEGSWNLPGNFQEPEWYA